MSLGPDVIGEYIHQQYLVTILNRVVADWADEEGIQAPPWVYLILGQLDGREANHGTTSDDVDLGSVGS